MKKLGFLTHALRQRWYPSTLQVVLAIIFGFILLQLIVGPASEGQNPGTVITWLLWWPLIPLTFVLAGRFWCAVCPFGTVGDWVRKLSGLNRPVPSFIKNHGLWIINGLFLLVTWYDVAYGLTTSVPATAVLLLLVLIGAAGFSLVYEKRAWCRYVCPVGGIFGNYSQTAFIELRGTREICQDCADMHCYKGREDLPGCALFVSPKNLASNRTCNFCGDCLKSCRKDSPKVVLRAKPGDELWRKARPRFDEAFLAASLVGLIAVSTLGMLEIWPVMIEPLSGALGLGYAAAASIYMLLLVAACLVVYTAGTYFSARLNKESFKLNFSRFGYALIPLNLTTHFAHNLSHFLGEGRLISGAAMTLFYPLTAAQAAVKTPAAGHGGAAGLIGDPYIQAIQFSLVGLGIMLSFYVARRVALAGGNDDTISWPHYAVIALFGFISFWLFSLPMSPRH